MMAYYKKDPSGGRPPTPYPFPSDPTWGTFRKPRRRRHSTPGKRDHVYTFKRVSHGGPGWVRRAGFLADCRLRTDPRSTRPGNYVSCYNSEPSLHLSIQRKIDEQNAEIASRLPHPRHGANSRGHTGRKRVRFELPELHREHHPKGDLAERFGRLDIKEQPKRCRLCGRQLKGGYRD